MRREFFNRDSMKTNRLRVSCSSLGSTALVKVMRRLPTRLLMLNLVAVWAAQTSLAQEAVSTTGGGSTGGSTGGSSASATSTTELSTGTGSSPAVSSAPTATSSMQSGPGGVGVFSPTPVRIYLSVFGGYDDNVNTNLGPNEGSTFVGGNVILDYTFGDPRTQIALNLGAGGNYYLDHVTSQDYNIDLKGALGITYKSSPRLTLGTKLLLEYLTEPNFENPNGQNSRNGNYFYTTDELYLQYAWSGRFSTRTFYTPEAYQYDNSAVALYADHFTNIFGNEFRFQMVPTTLLVVEYRYGIVSYNNEGALLIPASLGQPAVFLENDSTTHYVLGGIDHTFNPRFAGSLRGGAQFRSYDVGGDRTGPYFEGALNYAVGRRTSVTWTARYGLEEPEVPGAQSRTTFRTGLRTKFDLTSRFSSTLDLYYSHDDYHSAGPTFFPFSEDAFDAGLSLHYAITPLIGVQAGYHYTDVTSDGTGREYSRNRFSGGLSLKF